MMTHFSAAFWDKVCWESPKGLKTFQRINVEMLLFFSFCFKMKQNPLRGNWESPAHYAPSLVLGQLLILSLVDGTTLSFEVSWTDQQDSSGLAERQFSLKFLWSLQQFVVLFSVWLWSVGVAQWWVFALAEESAMQCEQPSQCTSGTLAEGCVSSDCETAAISSTVFLLKECAHVNS